MNELKEEIKNKIKVKFFSQVAWDVIGLMLSDVTYYIVN